MWNDTKSSRVPVSPDAAFRPDTQWSRKRSRNARAAGSAGPVVAGPPMRTEGSARTAPATAWS